MGYSELAQIYYYSNYLFGFSIFVIQYYNDYTSI
jgi:hypothetical protein